MGTKAGDVHRSRDPLEYTLDQIATHKIPIEQICRAVKREHRTAFKEYLAGKSPSKHFKIGGTK